MDTEPEFAPWVPKKRDPHILESTPDQQLVTKRWCLKTDSPKSAAQQRQVQANKKRLGNTMYIDVL